MMCLACLAWLPESQFELVPKVGVWHTVPGKTAHLSTNKKIEMQHKTRKKAGNQVSNNDIRTLLADIYAAIGAFLAEEGDADEAQTQTRAASKTTAKKSTASKAKAKPEPEPEEEGDADAGPVDEDELREELEALTVTVLRKRAVAAGFDPEDVKGAKKADVIDSLVEDALENADEEGDGDADPEDGDGDADDETAERRAELEGMTLGALRKYVREELDAEPSETRTLDKPGLIDLVLDAEKDDDSDSATDTDDNGDPEGDSDDDGYTKDELDAMDKDELIEILNEWEEPLPAKKVKPMLIKAILAAQ